MLRAASALAKSCPHDAHTVIPFFTSFPQMGHVRSLRRVINQMSESTTNPMKPITRMTPTPTPVPISHHVCLMSPSSS
jgi:hypothetical protein